MLFFGSLKSLRRNYAPFRIFIVTSCCLLVVYQSLAGQSQAGQSRAGVRCLDHFSEVHGHDFFSYSAGSKSFLSSIKELPPYWNKPGTLKIFDRYWEDRAVIQLASEVAQLPHENQCMVLDRQTEICFSATLSEDGQFLSISIPVISVGGDVSLGARPKSLSMEFLKIVSGVLRGAELVNNQGGQLKALEIYGLTTVNPSLAKLLGRLGLEPVRPPSLEGGADYRILLEFK